MVGVIRIGPGMKEKAELDLRASDTKHLDRSNPSMPVADAGEQCNLEPLREMAETLCPTRLMRLGSRYPHQQWIMQMVVKYVCRLVVVTTFLEQNHVQAP